MQKNPIAFQRPLVVIGGFLDPDVSPPIFAHYFASISSGATIIPVSVGLCGNDEDCRNTVIAAVDKACSDSDPIWTTEVDVVGVSLGGMVGRYAAAPSRDSNHHRRLKIARLFTISSPHAGAKIAGVIPLTGFGPELKPGSDFLKYVARFDATASYQIYPYVHLDDEIVGDKNAAPPGMNPYWLPNNAPYPPHMGAVLDERILADISRRLRGETPYTIPPAEPLPEVEGFE
jgi:pimeloyl-ACP methyl ester carboxylesterase